MANDWIKMRANLLTHPKVVRIVSALKTDRLRAIGALFAVWCLFDAHAVDGRIDGYTADTLDELIHWPGFSAAMAGVGWLEIEPEALVTPRFDEHNSQSAKRRATDAERKRDVRKTSATDADKMRTREEKRRGINTPLPPGGGNDQKPPQSAEPQHAQPAPQPPPRPPAPPTARPPAKPPDGRKPETAEQPPTRGAGRRDRWTPEPEGFAEVWRVYPNRSNRDKALRRFVRIAPDAALQQAIVAAVAAQSATDRWRRDGGRFVPELAKWLRGRQWLDEPGAVGGVADWWTTSDGIKTRGVALGLPFSLAALGNSFTDDARAAHWRAYRAKVFTAAGPGPWRTAA